MKIVDYEFLSKKIELTVGGWASHVMMLSVLVLVQGLIVVMAATDGKTFINSILSLQTVDIFPA